jgi:hypothetical protein
MGRKKSRAEHQNDSTYLMYYQRLTDYALSMFEWEGLPDSINRRFLELTILYQGRAVFFKDPNLGYLAMPVNYGGVINYYHEPTRYQAYSIDYQKELTLDTGVIIWNNYSRSSIMPIIQEYARRLYQVERAMDVNIQTQKFPVVFLTDETQRLTFQNLMEQYDGNEPFIFGNKQGFNPDSVQALQTGIPFVADKLMEYKHNLWNEAMTFLGIGNAKQDKKERLVEAEVSSNDEQIQSSRYVMLQARQYACELINQMFPELNISVDFKLNKEQQQTEELEEEDIDSGSN